MRTLKGTIAAVAIVAFTGSAHAAILADINADGTNRTASVTDFEEAAGLPIGTFSGDSVTAFPNNDPGGGAFSQAVNNITIAISDITNDADNWFSTNNYLLDDGLYHRDGAADPTALITLSGSGLDLAANTTYDLYLFAGRKQGHLTVFTFDVNDPSDPAGGTAIDVDPPIDGGDETLGTAKYTFSTGASAPSSLVIQWDGGKHVNGNQDAVFSGFALQVIPEPASLTLLGLGGLLMLRGRINIDRGRMPRPWRCGRNAHHPTDRSGRPRRRPTRLHVPHAGPRCRGVLPLGRAGRMELRMMKRVVCLDAGASDYVIDEVYFGPIVPGPSAALMVMTTVGIRRGVGRGPRV